MILDIWYICAASLLCESENENSDFQLDWMICCIWNICGASLHCEWARVSLNLKLDRMIYCNWCKCATFLHCASADDSSDVQLVWMICCIVYKSGVSLQCESTYEFSDSQLDWMMVAIGTNVQLFPVVLQLMTPQSSSFPEWHLFIFKINKKWAVISEIASLYHIEKKLWNDVITTFILVSRVQETEKKHKFSRNYIKSWLDRGKKHIFFPGQAAGRVCP